MNLEDPQTCETCIQGSQDTGMTGPWPRGMRQRSLTYRLMGLYCQYVAHRVVDPSHQAMNPQIHLGKPKMEKDPGSVATTLWMETALAG